MADSDKQQARNRLVVGIFAAACAGFIVAMYLGAFLGRNVNHDIKDLPDWVANSIAIASALISAFAVYLVAETLRATRDTLTATRIMAEDQREIGQTQLRPWLLLDEYKVFDDHYDEHFYLSISLKNFGTTPAQNVIASARVQEIAYENDLQGKISRKIIVVNLAKVETITAIAPSASHNFTFKFRYDNYHFMNKHSLGFSWEYTNYNDTITDEKEIFIKVNHDENDKIYIEAIER